MINHPSPISRIAPIVLSLSLAATSVFAQAPVLSGRVLDPQGGTVAGADVRIGREDGAVTRHAVSDAAGMFRFEAIAAGTFVLDVDKSGFRRRVTSIVIAADRATTVDVKLDIAGVDERVVVTAAGLPQMPEQISKAVTVVDSREIADRNEVTLSDIVRLVPGVQVRDSGGPGQPAAMRIRGLRPDAAAVLVDGLRLRDAAAAQGDITPFLSNLTFIATDRVEVLRGSGSSLYGTNAVGGAVNIVTNQGGGKLRAEAQTEFGSLGHARTRGSLSGSAMNNRLSFSAGGLQWNVTDGVDGDDAMRTTGGQGLVRYQGKNSTLTARVLTSNDRVAANQSPTVSGIPVTNVPTDGVVEAVPVPASEVAKADRGEPFAVGNATYFPGRNDPDYERSSWFQSTALQWQQVLSPRTSLQASYQRVHTSRAYANGPVGPGFQPFYPSLSEFVGNADTVDARIVSAPARGLTVTAGYEFEREAYNDHNDDNAPGPERVNTRMEITQRANAFFGAAQFGWLGDHLTVSLSGRTQGFDVSKPTFSTAGTPNPYAAVEVAAPPRAMTGDVSVAYVTSQSNTKIRVHTGNAYRAPALYERYGGGFYSDFFTGALVFSAYGDPTLEPDRYRTIDAGVDQGLWQDRVLVSATAFFIDVESITAFDLGSTIEFGSDPYGRSIGYVNGSGGPARGIELGVEAKPGAHLRLSASYTHTLAKTDSDITIPGFFLVPGVYSDTAAFLVTSDVTSRLTTTFDLLYTSSSYTAFTVGSFPASQVRAYRFPSSTRAALVASYRVLPSVTSNFRAYMKVDNLFDSTYFVGGWRAPGRTAVAGVSIGF